MARPATAKPGIAAPRAAKRFAPDIVREAGKGGFVASAQQPRVHAVLLAATESGLLEDKTGRISGRVSPALVRLAKARTGIGSDTDLIEFALANVALEDRFAESFKASRGTIDPDIDLGF